MKRKIPILLIMLLCLLVHSSCDNSTFMPTYGDYKYTTENGQVTIVQYLGTEEHVVFPSTIKEMPVVTIGDPLSESLFTYESGKNVESITIPDGVIEIDSFADFENCHSLKSITLSSTVRDISNTAFRECKELKYNIFENGCYLGTNDNPYFAFMSMIDDTTKTIDIHQDTVVIGGFALSDALISEISFPDSVKVINILALDNCKYLEKVYISKSIEFIDTSTFNGCDSIKEIIVFEENKYYKSVDGTLFTYDGTTLIKYALTQEVSFYQIPEGTQNIVSDAFNNAQYLKVINIPDSVTFIGDHAFANCILLKEVVIPDNVESIDYSAFAGCKNLESVVIGSGVKNIDRDVFFNCPLLKEVIFKDHQGWTVKGKLSIVTKKIDLSDSKKNVEYLTETYIGYWWEKE